MAPLILSIQYNRFSLCFPVCIELYLYAARTSAVLIICVIPALNHTNAGLSGCIGICYIMSLYMCLIIRYCILGNRIGDLCSILILRKICKTPAPVVIRADFFFIYFGSICQQSDRNGFRTLAVLIICIIPGLASGYFRCLRGMAVGNHKSFCHIPRNG